MAYKNMEVAPSYGNWQNHRQAYESEVSLASVTTSDIILIPQDVNNVSISVIVGAGGQGNVDVSNDSVYTVKNGAPTWIPNSIALVANTLINLEPCTAIRLNQSNAGTVKMCVRAQ